jgi:hypothetical protein
MLGTAKGLSDGKAARMMTALRDGQILRVFGVRAPRLEAYFKIHLDYALEARPLIEANAKAAQQRKGGEPQSDPLQIWPFARRCLRVSSARRVHQAGLPHVLGYSSKACRRDQARNC